MDGTGEPANRYGNQWNGTNRRPMEATGGFYERNGKTTCVGIVKGTGSWYIARVFGQIQPGDSCDATPDNFTGQHTGFYQIPATGDTGIGNPFLGGGGPRGIQLAAKNTF